MTDNCEANSASSAFEVELPSSIELANTLKWDLAPSAGRIRVRVDGKSAGWVGLEKPLKIAVEPGTHWVRVRFYTLMSPRVVVDVPSSSTVRLEAGLPPISAWIRVVMSIFRPFSLLELRREGSTSADPLDYASQPSGANRIIRIPVVLLLELLGVLLGTVLIFAGGAMSSMAVKVAGVATILLSSGAAIAQQLASSRKE